MVDVAFGDKEPAVGQIAEAWRKPEPQQVAEPEHVLGRAAGIGIVRPAERDLDLSWAFCQPTGPSSDCRSAQVVRITLPVFLRSSI